MIQIRVIKYATLEVVGAIEHAEAPRGDAYHWVIPGPPPVPVALPRIWYITDWGGNPTQPADQGTPDTEITVRLERFYICPEEYIGKIPGWVRVPPKRIMILGDKDNC